MNITKLAEAIRARALADTGTGGLFNVANPLVTGIYKDKAMGNLANSYPYIVFNIVDISNVDAFSVAVREVIVRFAIYSKDEAGGASRSAIVDRVLGNWLTASGRVPTYGYDRHALSISGGWSASAMIYQGFAEETDSKITQTVLEFRVYISKTASG